MLVWQLGVEWDYDPSVHTEVEVRFIAGLLETYGKITSLEPGPERSRSQASGASSSATRS